MSEQADVFQTLGSTVRALRAHLDRALQSQGLRLGQYQVLSVLWEHDGMTPRELSDRLQVEMPTVTRTAQRMVRDGLVRREAHPDDARSVRIRLTPKGNELREAVRSILADEKEAALKGFSQAEREELVRLLDLVGANVRHDAKAPRASHPGVQ